MKYAVMVKEFRQKMICHHGEIWVKDKDYTNYVNIDERGVWDTKEEAEQAKLYDDEIVVGV